MTGPPSNGLIGLGGQKGRPVFAQWGSLNSPRAAPSQNGRLRSLTTGSIVSATSPCLQHERVTADRTPHRPAGPRNLSSPRLAAKLGDEFANLTPSVHLRLAQLTTAGV